jgi:hypothetical protein
MHIHAHLNQILLQEKSFAEHAINLLQEEVGKQGTVTEKYGSAKNATDRRGTRMYK